MDALEWLDFHHEGEKGGEAREEREGKGMPNECFLKLRCRKAKNVAEES